MLLIPGNDGESNKETGYLVLVPLQTRSFLILQIYITVPPQFMQIWGRLYLY